MKATLKKVLNNLDEVTRELNSLDSISITDPGIVMEMKDKCSKLIKETGNEVRKIIEK